MPGQPWVADRDHLHADRASPGGARPAQALDRRPGGAGAPGTAGERQLECARSSVAFQRYLAARIEERRGAPRDDLLTALIEARDGGERLDVAELVNLLIVLVFAGHETTTNLIGNLLVLLLARPEVLRAVRDDPSLTDGVITEGLRMDGPVQGTFRTATEEVALGGARIPAGAKVMVLFGSANRDEAVFSHPGRFDPGRGNNHRHLGFGRGIHACLGASLARLRPGSFSTPWPSGFPIWRWTPAVRPRTSPA